MEPESKVEEGAGKVLAWVRGKVRKYPLLAVGVGAAGTYFMGQYGPAIRAGVRLVAPMVGLKCEG